MLTLPPLRSFSADAAIQLAMREAERLDMRLEMEFVGSQKYPIAVSHLMRGDIEVATGYGKGQGLEGVAGAQFEAFERYFMSARINRRLASGAVRLLNARDVARQQGLAGDLVIQRWAEDFPEGVAACAIHSNTASSVWYPIFLGDPHYHREPLPGDSVESYRTMSRYTSSLGTASGSNAVEAHLHGLCELIEHDSLSHALLRWFIARVPQVNVVDITSLPDRIKPLYDAASETVGAEVLLFDVATDIAVPAYLAVKGGSGAEVMPLGAGASPIGEYAAVRALSELIQVAVLIDEMAAREASVRLAAWPVLQECLTISRRLLNYRGVKRVPIRETVGDVRTVESALDTVANLLRRRGIYAYSCELAPPESLISVISSIAPGLERFSLVRMGLPVIPTGRGWNVWRSAAVRRRHRSTLVPEICPK